VKAKNKLVKSKIRRLAFTSLFPFHLMAVGVVFVHVSLYVMVLRVGGVYVLDLTDAITITSLKNATKMFFFSIWGSPPFKISGYASDLFNVSSRQQYTTV